jgi:hypothetical protein
MAISLGDLVEATARVDGKIRRGVVTGLFDEGVRVEMSSFNTLCTNPKAIGWSSFDSNERWWIENRKREFATQADKP